MQERMGRFGKPNCFHMAKFYKSMGQWYFCAMTWRKALFFLNPLYAFAVILRNWAYDRGLRRSVEFDVPVIGLGNLHAGGTGKSPHAVWIVNKLNKAGFSPAILSRGYGRFTKGFRWFKLIHLHGCW
jgi:tetraacyldisaccharide-1-P 4'-kinase